MTFTNAPVTRLTVLSLVSISIAASLFDAKQYFYILIDTHLFRYRQFWRLFSYQLCYMNSTEVLFAAISLYNLRVVERMWGSRKYAVSDIGACRMMQSTDKHNPTVIHRSFVTVHGSISAAHSYYPSTYSTEFVQLHAGRPDGNHLCRLGPISLHRPSDVQVPDCILPSAANKRAIFRRNLIRQILPVLHRLSSSPTAVARLCSRSYGWLGSGVFLESGVPAHVLYIMEATRMDCWLRLLQEKCRV